jgi:hypothetical protein
LIESRYITEIRIKMSYRIKTFDQFINEAEDTGIQKTGQSITIPVGGVFNSGTFEIGNKQIIDDKMPEIIAFLNQYPKNQRMEVNVEAMESQVPNSGVNMKPGELAEKRTQSMVNFLSQKLKDFKNVTILAGKPKTGTTPWQPEKGDKFDDEKFKKEQRVDVIIKPFGEKIEPPKEEDEFRFSAEYDGVPGGKSENEWSTARMGTFGFSVKGLDNAKKAYDFMMKPGGYEKKNSIWKKADRDELKDPQDRFFNLQHFRKFDSLEDFKEMFSEIGNRISFIGEMPNHFFLKSSGSRDVHGNPEHIENGLRPIWKAGAKDKTLG